MLPRVHDNVEERPTPYTPVEGVKWQCNNKVLWLVSKNSRADYLWLEVDGFVNQRSPKTGESLNRISIVIVPDPFFSLPTQKKKKRSGYARVGNTHSSYLYP